MSKHRKFHTTLSNNQLKFLTLDNEKDLKHQFSHRDGSTNATITKNMLKIKDKIASYKLSRPIGTPYIEKPKRVIKVIKPVNNPDI